MLTVKLYTMGSPKKSFRRALDTGIDFSTVQLKEDTSIEEPTLILKTDQNISNKNYLYISDFGRYYFVIDKTSVGYNLWKIRCHVDVLFSFKQGILANQAVIKRNQNKFNTYINDPEWRVYSNEDVITFKFSDSEFTKTLDYVLTVAGGA